MSDSNDILAGLNAPQRQAAEQTEGPLLVLAGAGSGKTRVITYRIAHLIEKGVNPGSILAVTFTNKAAKEMRERVESVVSGQAADTAHLGRATADFVERPESQYIRTLPTVTTFHAFGVRILREFHEALGLRRHFVIYDRSDSVKAIKTGLQNAGYDPKQFEPRKMLSIISRAKGDALTRDEFLDGARSFPERVAAAAWEHYDKVLKTEHALDFDDLLLKTLNLLKSHPPVLEKLQNRYQYIHVDEYQDTNQVQFQIAKLLAAKHNNICVVADVDQSIYGWRGADISNVLQFERTFPGAKTVFLEENYRSTQTIIAASNDIIAKNNNRIEKNVFTNNHAGDPISVYAAMNGTDEAEYIALEAKKLIKDGANASDIAVLYRTNFQSRALEEAFLNYGVQYQLLGTKFFERKEIKDVLSYLRLALNPGSTADLARVVNEPARGIGKVTLLKLIEGRRDELKGATLAKVETFEHIMMDIASAAKNKPLGETIKLIMKCTGLEQHLKDGGDDGLERLENLRELVTLAGRYHEYETEEALERFLEDAALQSDQDELEDKEKRDAVRLMTVHASKGLEFPYVFVAGMEEGLFPHERLDDEGNIDHEEERRLFYVALTRAEKKVFLSFAHMRTIFGSQRMNVPSSFLSDISEDLIEPHNAGGHESGHETTVWLD